MTIKQVLLCIGMCSLLAGCGEQEIDSFCKNHGKEHQLHRNNITQIKIDYSEQGQIVAQVKVEQAHAQRQMLAKMAHIIDVKADKTCTTGAIDIKEEGKYYQASYTLDCGVENKLNKVTVLVLDNFKTIEEIEVAISTPSSSKHFVLSRQCDSPIFNLIK
ncbi:MAG: hypothetical protein JKY14_02905 [Paraglaciecola sp.]|nr:hypothetical protein [Paraglaciecola sp.]